MYQKFWATLIAISIATLVTPSYPLPTPTSSADLLFDHFDGTALDTTKWTVIEQNGNIELSGGNLVTYGGIHKRVDSTATYNQVSAEARIMFSAATGTPDYMKFGFEVNAAVESPGLPGFYFDTIEPAAGGQAGHVFALAYDSNHANLLRVKIALGCERYHVFRIDWNPTEIRYYVDGALGASVAYSYSGGLNVGLWNDRSHTMKTDWVRAFSDTEVLRADAGGPYSGQEGDSFQFDGGGSSDPEGDSISYRWDFDSDGVWDTSASASPKATHAFPDDFSGFALLEVSDGTSAFSDEACVLTTNALPRPSIDAGPSPPVLGQPVVFTGFFDDAGSGDMHSARWDFGDGVTASGTYTPGVGASHHVMDPFAHTYAAQGTYVASLAVCDDENGCGAANITVILRNTPPQVDAGSNVAGTEGENLAFSGSFQDPDVGDTHTYSWDFGDNSGTAGTLSPTHTYADDGTYSVTLTVCDSAGACVDDSLQVTVANVAPILARLDDVWIVEGGRVVFSAVANDPGFDSPTAGTREDFTANVDWGEGTLEIIPVLEIPGGPGMPTSVAVSGLEHVYGDNGNYTVAIVACDDDGGCGSTAFTVNVTNVAPLVLAVTATATATIILRVAGEKWHDVRMELYQGDVLLGEGSVTRSPGSPDDQALTIGTFTLSPSEPLRARVVYTPLDDPVNGELWGADPAWIRFVYSDGNESRIHHTFNVRHPGTWVWEPDLTSTFFSNGVWFSAAAVDEGSDDLSFGWDFGDGARLLNTHFNNGATADLPLSPDGIYPFAATDVVRHVFSASGTLVVTITVLDDDGGIAVATIIVYLGR